tara:strand:- start:825 stop:1940 length:1116 start_codon:yes stop_codon:yes gene_type:complete
MFFLRKFFDFVKISSIIISTSFILSLVIDFFFGKAILNKLDPYFSQTDFYERLIRIDHKYYHHTLKKNVEYKKAAGFGEYHVLCTDNHGFKYKCNSTRDKKFKIAFLGDSFVEGIALNYEDTFVGIFENEKKVSVANLGVTSYAPNIYLSKMKFLLDNGYKFEHLILFVDISDLYDDNTFYKLNKDLSVTEKNAKAKNLKRRKFLRYNFPLTNYYMYVIKVNNRLNKEVPPLKSENPIFNDKAAKKAKWSYQTSDIVDGYDEPISKTQAEMIQAMSKLFELLKKNQIKLSLAVYPWPQQLQSDVMNSRHVQMWKNFCEGKCHKFINFFPFFFNEKEKKSFLEIYKKYYFWNDVHFNAEGNRIIAQKLLKEF